MCTQTHRRVLCCCGSARCRFPGLTFQNGVEIERLERNFQIHFAPKQNEIERNWLRLILDCLCRFWVRRDLCINFPRSNDSHSDNHMDQTTFVPLSLRRLKIRASLLHPNAPFLVSHSSLHIAVVWFKGKQTNRVNAKSWNFQVISSNNCPQF